MQQATTTTASPSLTIREVANGYVVNYEDYHGFDPLNTRVFSSIDELAEYLREHFGEE